MKAKTQVMPPAAKAWRCVILAVDPGDASGWSIWTNGGYKASGILEAHQRDAIPRVIEMLSEYAEDAGSPPVMVRERPFSARTIGPAWGMWDAAWERAFGNRRKVVKVWPSTWMSRVLGVSTKAGKEAIRGRSIQTARTIQALAGQSMRETTHDEAAAVCIGRWGTHAGEVGKALGKRAMKAAGYVG